MLIIAEVGDVTRFPTARHLCAWAGLAPTVRSSDGKARLGHISRQGSPALRWALTEAAQKIPTGGGPLRAMFERIAKRRGRNIAKVAVARQILTSATTGSGTARSAASSLSLTTTTASWPRRHGQRQLTPDLRSRGREVHARASSLLCLASFSNSSWTAVRLIEPPSTARHSGPPRATGWMTGASSPAGTQSANRRPTPEPHDQPHPPPCQTHPPASSAHSRRRSPTPANHGA